MSLQTEPAVTYGAAGTVILAVIGVLVAFHVHVDSTQTQALVVLVGALGAFVPLVAGILIRAKVTPVPVPRKPKPASLTEADVAALHALIASQQAQLAAAVPPAAGSVAELPGSLPPAAASTADPSATGVAP